MKDIRNSPQFYYTQQSLAAFESCPLKFRKRYMEGLRWDSRPDKEAKTALEKGNSFHLLARRYFMGIDYGLNEDAKDFELLAIWVRNLESFFEIRPGALYLPEYALRTNSGGLRLEANFDLLVIEDGRLSIWDWKTHGIQTPEGFKNLKDRLEKSLQTMVYLYVLMEEANMLTEKAADWETITMKYWQPEHPHVIAEIGYDAKKHEGFRKHLQEAVNKVIGYDYSYFDKSLYAKQCKYCEFNWFCNGTRSRFSAG